MVKKLVDLNASFVGAGGEGVWDAQGNPAPVRTGVAVFMDCPCGKCGKELCVPFANPLDGKEAIYPNNGWQRVGETIETLTLSPSVLRTPEYGGCGWHGYIRNGEAVEC